MNAMPARGERAGAPVSSPGHPGDLPRQDIQAVIARMAATHTQRADSTGGITALLSRRISSSEFLDTATDGEISQLMKMSSCGRYLDDLDPAADPGWAGVFFGVQYRRADCLGTLLAGDPELGLVQEGHGLSPSQAATRANAVTRSGFTALMLAARNGASDMVELLLKAGAEVDAVDAAGSNALMWATSSGSHAAVSALLKARPAFNRINAAGDTALMVAAHSGDLPMVKLLAGAGEFIDANLFRIIRERSYSLKTVNVLLQAGANPNTAVDGRSLLMMAAQGGDTLLMGALLTAGAQLAPAALAFLSGPTAAPGDGLASPGSSACGHPARHAPAAVPNALPHAPAQAYAVPAAGHAAASSAGAQAAAWDPAFASHGAGRQMLVHPGNGIAIDATFQPAGASARGNGVEAAVPPASRPEAPKAWKTSQTPFWPENRIRPERWMPWALRRGRPHAVSWRCTGSW
ncbi:ankyrin repeat domain-containing protein [Comamonas endophytica]|uniref:ankyrin repeat domain-containing protein n=1 Tax=Comamonas endophytica TaxID=2949090 RepID=UPI0036233737